MYELRISVAIELPCCIYYGLLTLVNKEAFAQ